MDQNTPKNIPAVNVAPSSTSSQVASPAPAISVVDPKEKRKKFLKKFIPILTGSLLGGAIIAGTVCSVVQCSTYNEVFTTIGIKENLAFVAKTQSNSGVANQSISFSKQPDDNQVKVLLKNKTHPEDPESTGKFDLELIPENESDPETYSVNNKISRFKIEFVNKSAILSNLKQGQSVYSNYDLEITYKHKGKEFKQNLVDNKITMTYHDDVVKPLITESTLYEAGSSGSFSYFDDQGFAIESNYGYITDLTTVDWTGAGKEIKIEITQVNDQEQELVDPDISGLTAKVEKKEDSKNILYVDMGKSKSSATSLENKSLKFKFKVSPVKDDAMWKEIYFIHIFNIAKEINK